MTRRAKLVETLKTDIRVHMALLFVVMLVANFFTPRIVDDLGQRQGDVFSFAAIFSWLADRYTTWSGRMVADFNNAVFLGLPKAVFNVLNAAFYVVFIYLVYRHALGAKKLSNTKSVLLFIITQILVFFTIPTFGQVVLWESGATNYLWCGVFILAFLLPFRLYTTDLTSPNHEAVASYFAQHKAALIALSFLGIIAGWTNENTAAGMLFMEVVFILYLLRSHVKVPPCFWTGFAASLTGFAGMILAPGNYARMAGEAPSYTPTLFQRLHNDAAGTLDVYLSYPGFRYILALFIVLTAALILLNRRRTLKSAYFYFVTSFLVIVVYCATGRAPAFYRALFGSSFFFIIAVLILLIAILDYRPAYIASRIIVPVFTVFMVLQAAYAGVGILNLWYQEGVRQAYIAQQIAQGNTNPVIPLIVRRIDTVWNPFHDLEDVSPDPSYWTNSCFRSYFNTDSVMGTGRDRWLHFYQSGDPALMNLVDKADYATQGLAQPDIERIIVVGDKPTAELQAFLAEHGIELSAGTPRVFTLVDGALTPVAPLESGEDYHMDVGPTTVELNLDEDMTFTVDGYSWKDDLKHNDAILSLRPDGTICDYVLLNRTSQRVVR